MLGNLLRVPRPHLPHRAAYSILPVGALKEVGGLPFLTSRQPNDAPKPPSTGATCVPELGCPCLSLSLALLHSPTRLHAQRIWIELLPRSPLSLLSFFLSASHCLCFFSTLSVPQDFLTNSVRFHSLLSTAEPSFARTLVLYSETIGTGVPGDGLVDSQPCGSSCRCQARSLQQ
jgi:hypothetical protein